MDIQPIENHSQSARLIIDQASGSHANSTVSRTETTQTADAVKATSQASAQADIETVTKAVKDINKTIQTLSRDLEFSLEEHSNRIIVKVVDQQTKEVLRQIPSQEVLEISHSLDKLQGILIKQQA